MDDASLVRAASEGDKEAFAALYDRYAAGLHNFLCSVLHDRDGAADVLHDTFILAGSRLHQLRDPAKVRPWLYAIARHLALRDLKRRSRQEPLAEVDVTATDRDASDVAAADELAELVRAAAGGLNARDRVVLDLHLRGGLEGQELGDALGVSASHAYVLMSRLRDQVERSLGALLVARRGRRDCPALATVLEGWDGTFTTVWRKRVARHADDCATCTDIRRKSASGLALLSASPALALPADLREVVLGDVQLASHSGRAWPAWRDGFPPPMSRRRHRRGLVAAVAALLLIVLGATAVAKLGGDGGATSVASGGPTTSSPTSGPVGAGGPGSSPSPVAPSSSTPEASGGGGPTGGGPAGGAGPPTSDPAGTGSTVSSLAPSPSTTDPVDPVATTAPPTTKATSTTTTTGPATTTTRPNTTVARDTDPPNLSGLTVDPRVVAAASFCSSNFPPTTKVSVAASDPSGIGSVVVEWLGGPTGGVPLTVTGPGTYAETLGPFSMQVGSGQSKLLTLTVRATDRAGNVAVLTTDIELRC